MSHVRSYGRHRLLALVTVFVLLVSGMPVTHAQPATSASSSSASCIAASEPNDQPDTATDLGSGAACGSGNYPGGGQDLYRWTVTDAEASAHRFLRHQSEQPERLGRIT